MLKQIFITATVIVIIVLAGCSKRYNPANTPFAIYQPIPEDNVRKLEKGVTSPWDVVKLFGEPGKKNISDRGERYVYGYLGDTLFVNFDSTHTIESFLFRPTIFSPVTGNTDYTNRTLSKSRLRKIEIYNTTRGDLEKWFRKPNKKETSQNRNRYTFTRKNGTLVVYTLANYEERVLNYTFTPAD